MGKKGKKFSEAHKKALAIAQQKRRAADGTSRRSEEKKQKRIDYCAVDVFYLKNLRTMIRAMERNPKHDPQDYKDLLKYRDIMAFRSNTRYRQYQVITRSVENYESIKDRFADAPSKQQNKLYDNYMYFLKTALNRIIIKNEETDVLQTTKKFLYPDIELSVHYLYSLKGLYRYLKDPSIVDPLELEELTIGFTGILEELNLSEYSRTIRFPINRPSTDKP